MPTYDYKCVECGRMESVVQSMREYVASPIRPTCHGEMERHLSVVAGHMNPLAGDSHYHGLRGPRGEDVGSRTKHREFMKNSGLTTIDDFRGVFAKAEQERRAAHQVDRDLHRLVTEQVMTAVAKPD